MVSFSGEVRVSGLTVNHLSCEVDSLGFLKVGSATIENLEWRVDKAPFSKAGLESSTIGSMKWEVVSSPGSSIKGDSTVKSGKVEKVCKGINWPNAKLKLANLQAEC